MKWLAFLTLIRDSLLALREFSKRVAKSARKRKLKKATTEAKEGDQRGVEEALSGKSGNPTKHEYDGLRTQDAKKRRRSVAD